ncbi:hypothetical protein N7G274_007239 [Stereocaulon virgatum]|uniref:Uncharacterized protein n=1 Tax=Stereocaulon virgatum TaxID=373712 RepID=A0ABR4A2F8_9LECA
MGQAVNVAEKLEEIKKEAAEEAIAKYTAQLQAQERGKLTAVEVEAARALAKAAAVAKAKAKAARKAREDTQVAIQNSADKTVPSPTEEDEFSEDSIDPDPEVQKSMDEQENWEEWQRQQHTYSVKATLKADTHTGQRVRRSNRIGIEN